MTPLPGWNPLTAPKQISDKRFQICTECPHFNDAIKTCKICNCYMPIKTSINKQECPDKPPRWKRFTYDEYERLVSNDLL